MFTHQKSKHVDFNQAYKKYNKILEIIPFIKKKHEKEKRQRYVKYFLYFLLAVFLIFLFIFISLITNGRKIYSLAMDGKENLEQAVYCVKERDFQNSEKYALAAENDFKLAFIKTQNVKNNFFIKYTYFFKKQLDDIENLTKFAEILSKAMASGSEIGQEFNYVSDSLNDEAFSKFSVEEKQRILKLFHESAPELNGIKANLDLASLSLEKVNCYGALFFAKNKINELKVQLNEGREFLSNMVFFVQTIPVLAGYPDQSNFLVMFQNNDELRPTGGFLGTYGIMQIKNSDILEFETHDIYHMDMPIKDELNINPPQAIKDYLVDKWFMRDVNWSPDWPTSAQKIEWFFKQEEALMPAKDKVNKYQGEFDGVMAITPVFVSDLLALTGPIVIDNKEYNQDNFHDLLQYEVELGYVEDRSSWERKEVIGEILKELKIRLLDLPFNQWLSVFSTINKRLSTKDILVYLHDDYSQNLIKEAGWTGDIKQVNDDYLMVVDSNMGSFKTDAVMNKNIDYSLEETEEGLFAKLKISYAHHGEFDWRTTTYNTYTRVYVPEGSELIKMEGGKIDAIVGDELGKTVFATFLQVTPGEMKDLYLEYKLPVEQEQIVKNGSYSLYVQKQPGNNVDKLSVDLSLINEVKFYSPTGFNVSKTNGNHIEWDSDFYTDKVYSVEN